MPADEPLKYCLHTLWRPQRPLYSQVSKQARMNTTTNNHCIIGKCYNNCQEPCNLELPCGRRWPMGVINRRPTGSDQLESIETTLPLPREVHHCWAGINHIEYQSYDWLGACVHLLLSATALFFPVYVGCACLHLPALETRIAGKGLVLPPFQGISVCSLILVLF